MSYRIVFAVALALIAGTLVGCKTAPIKNIPKTSIQSSNASIEEVGKAIMTAGAGLGWAMKRQYPGLIFGTLLIRSHMAQVTISYSPTYYSITYKDSSNLKYSATNKTIHGNYNGWIQNLDNAIRTHLSML